MNTVFSATSSWKGRNEKIQALQSKLQRAEKTKGTKSIAASPSRAASDLKNMRSRRQKEQEALSTQNDSLQQQLTTALTKSEALTSRIKVLEKQCHKSKGAVQVLLEKSSTDDLLISALTQEGDRVREKCAILKKQGGELSVTKKSTGRQETYAHVLQLEKKNASLETEVC